MQETKADDYGEQWDQLYIDDYVSNVGIYFEGADSFLTDIRCKFDVRKFRRERKRYHNIQIL